MDRHGVKRLPVVDADGVSEGVVTVSGVVSKHTEAIAAVAASRDALTAAAG
jgi:CBS domain-containing protein